MVTQQLVKVIRPHGTVTQICHMYLIKKGKLGLAGGGGGGASNESPLVSLFLLF